MDESGDYLTKETQDFRSEIGLLNRNKDYREIDHDISLFTNFADKNVVVNWKNESLKGNFMPAILKLERNEINVDDSVEELNHNKLIHLAVGYSYLNVTRCLLEKFSGTLNIKNGHGHTPLHVLCNSLTHDYYLFSYLIKNDTLVLNPIDNTGVTPIFYSIMSKFNLAFLTLAYLKSDLNHLDGFGNNIFYVALSSDNKFALKFLLFHMPLLNINKAFYKNELKLSDVLITTKNKSCTKHFAKYLHNELHLITIDSCKKLLDNFKFYNKFNYDLINTVYYYKSRNYFSFIKALLRREKPNRHYYTYRFYNLYFMIYHLILKNTDVFFKYLFLFLYNFLICYFLYHLFLINTKRLDSGFTIKNMIEISKILYIIPVNFCLLVFLCIYRKQKIEKQLFSIYDDNKKIKSFYELQYTLNHPGHRLENVCHQIHQAMERNPLDLFFEDKICEVCLIKKGINTNHCNVCKRCVKFFYFHSKLLNVCFNVRNIYYYILYLSSIIGIHFSILTLFYSTIDINNEVSIYESDYMLGNLCIFMMNINIMYWILILYLLCSIIYLIPKILSFIICIGYRVSYYNIYRYHKKSIGKIVMRETQFFNVPHMNETSVKEFIKNLILWSLSLWRCRRK